MSKRLVRREFVSFFVSPVGITTQRIRPTRPRRWIRFYRNVRPVAVVSLLTTDKSLDDHETTSIEKLKSHPNMCGIHQTRGDQAHHSHRRSVHRNSNLVCCGLFFDVIILVFCLGLWYNGIPPYSHVRASLWRVCHVGKMVKANA